MRFRDEFVSRTHRFSLGREEESGRRYLAIPVSNGLVDYEEYYEISEKAFELYRNDESAALPFVAQCRSRKADERLMVMPGRDRGTAT